jgi:hypothetical protein
MKFTQERRGEAESLDAVPGLILPCGSTVSILSFRDFSCERVASREMS